MNRPTRSLRHGHLPRVRGNPVPNGLRPKARSRAGAGPFRGRGWPSSCGSYRGDDVLLPFRPGLGLAALGWLNHGTELQLLTQRIGDAVGFCDVLGEVAAVLPGAGFARAADVGDARVVQ